MTGVLTDLSIPTLVLSPTVVSSVNSSPENQTEKDKRYILHSGFENDNLLSITHSYHFP